MHGFKPTSCVEYSANRVVLICRPEDGLISGLSTGSNCEAGGELPGLGVQASRGGSSAWMHTFSNPNVAAALPGALPVGATPTSPAMPTAAINPAQMTRPQFPLPIHGLTLSGFNGTASVPAVAPLLAVAAAGCPSVAVSPIYPLSAALGQHQVLPSQQLQPAHAPGAPAQEHGAKAAVPTADGGEAGGPEAEERAHRRSQCDAAPSPTLGAGPAGALSARHALPSAASAAPAGAIHGGAVAGGGGGAGAGGEGSRALEGDEAVKRQLREENLLLRKRLREVRPRAPSACVARARRVCVCVRARASARARSSTHAVRRACPRAVQGCWGSAGAGRAERAGGAARRASASWTGCARFPPPLVLSGHAASLTPY